ncbi:MAG: dihydroorotate dehydrogenase electron transfer subunit [Clostridia bacterium]|nr:dihydroorotate dehydrogenase electron transfer subunit [Clostridia bacterium]
MPVNEKAKLVAKEELILGIFKFSVVAPEIVEQAKTGQFIEIRVNDDIEPFLRRPISIHNMDRKSGKLEFIFQVKGKGTEILAKRNVGDLIDVVGPLGNGNFDYSKYEKIGIIGGGIGVFPLYELAKNAKNDGKDVSIYLGFRNKDLVVLEDEFKNVSTNFILTTDDGSYSKKGFAIDFLKEDIENGKVDSIYACGPLPMLKAVQKLAIEKNIPCQLSLEEKMACGLGVCLGCAVKTSDSTKEAPQYKHVCKNGPVFDAKDVEI